MKHNTPSHVLIIGGGGRGKVDQPEEVVMFHAESPQLFSALGSGTPKDVGPVRLVLIQGSNDNDEVTLAIRQLDDTRPAETLQTNSVQVEQETTVVDAQSVFRTRGGLKNSVMKTKLLMINRALHENEAL